MTAPISLADWLAYCAAMHPTTMDLSLERTVAVARRLGIQFSVPVITVAGTNGKGSTCAMIDSIARHAGYRVGVYQKPELVHFNERCRIGGQPVSEADLVLQFEAVEAARGDRVQTRALRRRAVRPRQADGDRGHRARWPGVLVSFPRHAPRVR